MRRVVSCAAAFIALLLLVGTVAVGVAATTSAAAPVPVRICHIPVQYIGNDRVFARHALFATHYLAPRFPNLNVSFDYATANGGPTIQDVATGLFSPRALACDALVGPQWSSVSVGISALVNVPWVSHTATSTRLSNKEEHPWFSRMLPTDDFGGAGMAAVALAFEWTEASVICVDDAYGQSLLSGFRKQHVANGGSIEQTHCLNADATADEVLAAIAPLREARGRVVMVAGASSANVMSLIVDAVLQYDMQRSHAFVFSESPCASKWPRLRDLPGSFCVSYTTNPNVTTSYDAAWRAHDNRTLFAGLENLGIPTPADPYEVSLYSYLIHDCVLALLTALHSALPEVNPATLPAPRETLRVLRSQLVSAGASGVINLDSNGDRVGALMVMNNIYPVPNSTDGFDFDGFATWSPVGGFEWRIPRSPLFWLASGRGPRPELQVKRVSDNRGPSTELLTGLLCGVVIVLCGLAALIKIGCSDASVIAKLIHSGVAAAFVSGIFDCTDIIVRVFSAATVVTNDTYTQNFKFAWVAVCVVATAAVLLDVGCIIAFIITVIPAGGELKPADTGKWKFRLSGAASVSLFLADLPVLSLSFASILLGAEETDDVVLATFILSCVAAGAKAVEPGELLNHSTRAPPVELQEKVQETFPDIVPLHHKSDLSDLRLVRRFIRKQDVLRDNELFKTAKHVATAFARVDVTLHEFYAVLWLGIARLYILECRHAAFMETGIDENDEDDEELYQDDTTTTATTATTTSTHDDGSGGVEAGNADVVRVPSANLHAAQQQRSDKFSRSNQLQQGMQAYATALPTDDVDLVITAPPPKQRRRWKKAATVINMRRKLSTRPPSSAGGTTPDEVLSPPTTLDGRVTGDEGRHDGQQQGTPTPSSLVLPPHTVATVGGDDDQEGAPLGITHSSRGRRGYEGEREAAAAVAKTAAADGGGGDFAAGAGGVSGSGLSLPAHADENESDDAAADPAAGCEKPSTSSGSSAGRADDDDGPLLPHTPARRSDKAEEERQRRPVDEPSGRAAVYADGESGGGSDGDDAAFAPEESAKAEPATRPAEADE